MKRIVVIFLAAVMTFAICSCRKIAVENSKPSETITIEIDASDLYYVRGWMNTGHRNAYYKDNKEALDKLVDMIEGEYRYVETYSNEGRSGGGPYPITLYDSKGDVIYQISYRNNTLFFPDDHKSVFFVYEKVDSELSFEWFEEYLRDMWN